MKTNVKLFGIIALVAVMTFSMAACDSGGGGGNNRGNSDNNSKDPPVTTTPSNVSVYVSGYHYISTTYNTACYWKDGARTDLTPIGTESYAHGIAVQGSDVYVAGYYFNGIGDNHKACYWKNGVKTDMPEQVAYGNGGIAVQDGDVYVVGSYLDENGSLKFKGCYWKNGVITDLSIPDGYEGNAHDIAVQGGDVYVAGFYHLIGSGNKGFLACYWKNGVKTDLTIPNGYNGLSLGIAVQGGDVYVAGYYYDKNYDDYEANNDPTACYWKNGTRTDLPLANVSYARAEGITIQGSDVYVSGWFADKSYNKSVCYWKNGARTDIGESIHDHAPGFVRIAVQGNDICVISNDIYEEGEFVNYEPYYWVNGVRTDLSIPNGVVTLLNGIAVVAR